jgi:hypothetical protein
MWLGTKAGRRLADLFSLGFVLYSDKKPELLHHAKSITNYSFLHMIL